MRRTTSRAASKTSRMCPPWSLCRHWSQSPALLTAATPGERPSSRCTDDTMSYKHKIAPLYYRAASEHLGVASRSTNTNTNSQSDR
eukprot:1192331-Prorocentrum_minimum.AAC.1